jgi:hypothetical protein
MKLRVKTIQIDVQVNREIRMTDKEIQAKNAREATGWLTMVFMMLLFPVLFFLCVWAPMWFGSTTPY